MRRIAVSLALAAVAAAAPAVASEALSGDALKRTVSGKQIYLATPFGGEFPLNYKTNGVVDGSGKAIGLGRFMRPTDSGRWWVDGPKLCQKWTTWYDGKPFCFTVERTGKNRISWVRDDGLSGAARIAD